MNENHAVTTSERSNLVRGLYMLVMAVAYQISGTVLFFVSVIQLVIALITGTPVARLAAFGHSLAIYSKQLVDFLTFASEDIPFPFNDWPAGE
jgi:hypothetical protein